VPWHLSKERPEALAEPLRQAVLTETT